MKTEPKFLVDFMLGRLAKWLRIFGYNTAYATDKNSSSIIIKSLKENRILVTRDHRLSRKRAWKLVLINSDHLAGQMKQLMQETGITVSQSRFFTRCTLCNSPIEQVTQKENIKELVPEYVYNTQDIFSQCTSCKKIYWRGTHFELLLKDLAKAGIKLHN
jgi:uncharacterized protein with PIN domain